MIVRIDPFNAAGEITAPPSKSYAHRYIIAAFLAGKPCVIKNAGDSDDVRVTVSAVKSLGAVVEKRDGDVIFRGRKKVARATVDCGESGSTLRFLTPVCAALGTDAEFICKGRLAERPMGSIANALEGHGATVAGLKVSGKLDCGRYFLDASVSSQFVSGLLFALSALDGESEIVLTGKRVSSGYIDITLDVLRCFGVSVHDVESGFKIKGGYDPPETVSVEGDWSGAAFPLAIGALTGSVTVNNLTYPSLQADSVFLGILKKFGAEVRVGGGKITVSRAYLRSAGEIDCENSPDIAQAVAAVAAFAEGKTRLTGVSRLKLKESDRIGAIINTLFTCGVRAEFDGEGIIVYGGKPKGCVFSGGKDHRTVMSAAIIAAAADGCSEITDTEYTAKSYPAFFEDIKLLGGKPYGLF